MSVLDKVIASLPALIAMGGNVAWGLFWQRYRPDFARIHYGIAVAVCLLAAWPLWQIWT